VPTRTIALLIAAVAAVSWSGPLVRLAGEAPPLMIAFWRTALATAVLAPLALARHRQEISQLTRRDLIQMLAAGAFLALHFATWIASINLTTIASSVLLVSSTPLFVAAASAAIGERLPRAGWVGMAVAVGGVVLVAGADLAEIATAGRGNLLALAGAVTGAGYLFMGRQVRRRRSLLVYASGVYGICCLAVLAGAILTGNDLVGYPVETWLIVAAIGVGPQLIGHTAFNFLLQEVEASRVTAAILGEPLGSALIAVALFGEVPSWWVLPGAVLLLGGVGVVLRSGGRTAEPAPAG
jgi:drug/metabolite transporter (DMT)-like permease